MTIMAAVVHPHVETDEFEMLQENVGWTLDMELIAGEAVMIPPIGVPESAARGELHVALREGQEDVDDHGVTLQNVFVALPAGSRLAPDISWWCVERLPSAPPRALAWGMRQTVPDLVVEVLSPSTRANDLGVKRELYVDSGVRELWLVDPDAHTVTRVRPDTSPDRVLGEGSVLTSELLEGFAMDIARIFSLLASSSDGRS